MSTSAGLMNLSILNEQMRDLSAHERIVLAYQLFGEDLVLATSFGPTSAAMLSLAQSVCRSIRVVTVRHGYETPEMLDYARQIQQRLDLDVRVYQGEFLPIPNETSTAFAEFQNRAKVLPFHKALEKERARAWLSGVMRAESPARRGFDFVMIQSGLPAMYPILDWTVEQVGAFCEKNQVPMLASYYDPTKGAGQKRECGLHRDPRVAP